jgi:hypothetical protein
MTAKTRKPQTAEEYQAQLRAFYSAGPHINSENWLLESLVDVSPDQKTDRVRILHACEQAYFRGEYERCLELISQGEKVFGVSDYMIESFTESEDTKDNNDNRDKKENKENKDIAKSKTDDTEITKVDCAGNDDSLEHDKLTVPILNITSKTVRKTARIERHIVELLKIKQKCIARINSDK